MLKMLRSPLVRGYLVLVVLFCLGVVVSELLSTGGPFEWSPVGYFSMIGLLVLGVPWSTMGISALRDSHAFLALLVLPLSGFLNAVILYWLSRGVARMHKSPITLLPRL